MPMKLEILSLLLNMLSTHQDDCFQVIDKKHHTIKKDDDVATCLIWAEN